LVYLLPQEFNPGYDGKLSSRYGQYRSNIT
jgi:hypothetical protein